MYSLLMTLYDNIFPKGRYDTDLHLPINTFTKRLYHISYRLTHFLKDDAIPTYAFT